MSDDSPFHIRLRFNQKIMSVCDQRDQCLKDASFWLPFSNIDRVCVFMKISNIAKIQSNEHFTKLLAARMVVALQR